MKLLHAFGRNRHLLLMLSVASIMESCGESNQSVPLFNGENLQGWEGKDKYFRVEDQAIVAGRLDEMIPQNEFLCTTRNYENFDLSLNVRLTGEGDNGGVQFRSQRVADSHEVSGYQADIGFIPSAWIKQFPRFRRFANNLEDDIPYPLWGSLYDEARRSRILALGEREVVLENLKPNDWNKLRIRAVNQQIKIWLNDVPISEFIESEGMARTGLICLQVHSGPPLEVWYKGLIIKEL